MTKQLSISQILIYYDLPELFVATDNALTNYLCLLLDISNNSPLYYATPISQKRLSNFVQGAVELYSLLVEPEVNDWYFFHLDKNQIVAEYIDIDKFPEKYLPEKGFFVNDKIANNDQIVNEVIEKGNAVVHLAVSDINDDFGVDTNDLSDVLKLYTAILENSYKKTISEHNFKEKKSFVHPQNYKMRAFDSSYSSFNIHLYSQSQKDLFGNCAVEYGLEKIEKIFSNYDKEDDLISTLKSVKGHAISSFKKLLKKIIDKNLKIKHKWFAPNQKEVHFKTIDADRAKIVYNILNLSVEFEEEIKEFIGVFVQADIERGTWRLKSAEDNKEYNGEGTSEQLKGITLETVKYKLICQEIIQEFKVTENEKVKYIFKDILIENQN